MNNLVSKIFIPIFLIFLFSILYVIPDNNNKIKDNKEISHQEKVALLEPDQPVAIIEINNKNTVISQKKLKLQKRKEIKQKYLNNIIYAYVVSPYNNLIIDKVNENIKNTLEENGINENTRISYTYISLDEDSNNEREVISNINKEEHDKKIIISYGEKVTNLILENTNNIPIFSTLFANENYLEDTARINYGIKTPIELKDIVKFIKEVFKDKRIGVFYDNNDYISQENSKKIEKSFSKRKINAKFIGINSIEEIDNFNAFFEDNKFDVIIFVTGNIFVQNVETLNDKLNMIDIPLITLSQEEFYFYNSIFSTGINYNIVGKEIGKEMVDFINNNIRINKIEKAKEYTTFINKERIDKYNLDVPQDVLSLADETI